MHLCRRQYSLRGSSEIPNNGNNSATLLPSSRPLSNSQRICKVVLELIDTERFYVRVRLQRTQVSFANFAHIVYNYNYYFIPQLLVWQLLIKSWCWEWHVVYALLLILLFFTILLLLFVLTLILLVSLWVLYHSVLCTG